MDKNLKTALIIGGIVVVVIIVLPLIFGAVMGWRYGGWGMMGPGMMGPGMMGGFGWWWLMPVIPIVFLGLIIWGIVSLVRGLSGSGGSGSSRADSALEILKKRYARGDITKEEYEEKKKDLI